MKPTISKFMGYSVSKYELHNGWIWLSIKYDKPYTPSWRELQTIKNDIVGVDREAVEVYPREDCIIDTLNIYHLWVLPQGLSFPFLESSGREVCEKEDLKDAK